MDLVEAAARTGRSDDAAWHARLRDGGIGALSTRLMLVGRGSAAIAALGETALTLFQEALAIPGIECWPFDLARVQLAFGERPRRARATRESRVHLIAALETFERLGAKPWVA